VGHRLPIARVMLQAARCTLVMVDYRGFGLSDPSPPCEKGLQHDAVAVLDYVATNIGITALRPVVVMGVSLGGAVTNYIATHRQYGRLISALILENTFTCISDMADSLIIPMANNRWPRAGPYCLAPLFRYWFKPLALQMHWRSIDRIRNITCPILFLAAVQDEIVPHVHMRRLHEAAVKSRDRRLVTFPTGHHNDLCTKEGFFSHFAEFLAAVGVASVAAGDPVVGVVGGGSGNGPRGGGLGGSQGAMAAAAMGSGGSSSAGSSSTGGVLLRRSSPTVISE
jgi:pimeloyl-ACP methyl ester carboxylesterase